MAWKKGQSGNPLGKSADKVFADAIRMAVSEEDATSGKRKLRLIAEKVVAEAIKGESWAVSQVADRLDGKPAQESTVTIHRTFDDMSDNELAGAIAELRAEVEAAGSLRGNGSASIDPSQLN